MNDIISFLDLEDPDIFVSDIRIDGMTKYVTVETEPGLHFCPLCRFRMHSKGIRTRTINHPILQDNYRLVLLLKQRRWRCTNPDCRYETDEHFRFVDRYRRVTNATEQLVVNSFRDLSLSAAEIGKMYHLSDTEVLTIFDKYVDMKRLPLTDVISVDEVYLDMDPYCKYALVIQDFRTGDPIDLIQSRRNNVTEPYFSNIPGEEKARVRYLISDMYNPYLAYVPRYFPNAVPVVDSFHVTQWLVNKLDLFLRNLLKKYKQRDEERWSNTAAPDPAHQQRRPVSDEVHLLQKYRWLLLSNQSNITYHEELRFDRHFRRYMRTDDYENLFFALHPDLRTYRDLKEVYIRFNMRNAGNPEQAAVEIEEVIDCFVYSGYQIFCDFGLLLEKYKEPIINSFVVVKRLNVSGSYDSRLSNGPIESLNRKAKDLKRLCHGFRSFYHMRNRFLFSTRRDPILKGHL